MRYLVTGGAGFIGSNFIRFIFNKYGDDAQVVNLDKLTYAGIRENLAEYEGKKNYRFVHGDIAKPEDVAEAYKGIDGNGIDVVVNFAAETHVDRSLMEAGSFIETDVHGVLVLLEEARKHAPAIIFIDELDAIVTRASNNYGPWQYPEKLIPLFITNAIDNLPLPLYGDGRNVRDWLFVEDHCAAVDFLIEHGTNSETYNVGGGNEMENRDITHRILDLLGKPKSLIKPVADRQGHDRRYSISTSKLEKLGFKHDTDFDAALQRTVDWYVKNEKWWRGIKERSAEFKAYYERQYGRR